MFGLTRSQVQPIGLDLGHDSIKMMQLEVIGESAPGLPGRGLAVVAAAKQALPDEARKNPEKRMALVAETVRRMLTRQPFVGRRVVATLPREMIHVKNLRLPLIPAAELEAAVQFEARTAFSFDIDDARVQFLPAGEVRQGNETRQEVVVLAVKNTDANACLEQLEQCGVVVESLDSEITGLFRAFERFIRRREDEQEVHVIVDIGVRRTQVMIGRGRDISFYKPIDIGGQHLLEAVGRKLGITTDEAKALRQRLLDSGETASVKDARQDAVRQAVLDATRSVAEELGRELVMCLRYHSVTFRGHRPARVRMVGGEANDPQLHAVFKSLLSVPIEAARPLLSVDTSRMKPMDRRGTMSQWSLAMGLGLRMTTGYFAAKDGRPRAAVAAAPVITEATGGLTPGIGEAVAVAAQATAESARLGVAVA